MDLSEPRCLAASGRSARCLSRAGHSARFLSRAGRSARCLSRAGRAPAMLLLTEEQKRSYAADGFVLLDNVFTGEEVDEISSAYDAVFDRWVPPGET